MIRWAFISLLFVGSFVQAEGLEIMVTLKPIEALVMTDFVGDEAIQCDAMDAALEKQIVAGQLLYIEISKHLSAVSLQYGNWYEQLAPLEGKTANFHEGQFDAFLESFHLGERSVLLWDEITEAYRSQLFLIADVLMECAPDADAAKLDKVYLDIEKLADEGFELDSTVSSFMGLMFNSLKDFHAVLKKVEGKQVQVPSGLFKEIKVASADFHEAGILVNSGYQYLERRLKALEKAVLELLPPAQNLEPPKELASRP